MAFPSAWAQKQTITIDNTKVSGTGSHTNVQVLITLDHLDKRISDVELNVAEKYVRNENFLRLENQILSKLERIEMKIDHKADK